MRTLGTVILAAIAFAVIFAGALLGVLGYINEQRRPHCGNCTAWDRDLRICWWDRQERGEYDKGCEQHKREIKNEIEYDR